MGSTVTIFSDQRILRDRASNGDPVLERSWCQLGVGRWLVVGRLAAEWCSVRVARAVTKFFKWILFFIFRCKLLKNNW